MTLSQKILAANKSVTLHTKATPYTTIMKYLEQEQPPTCLHILGQGLVNEIWKEGRELKEENKRLRKRIAVLVKTLKME